MKNKGIVRILLSLLVSILLVFSFIGVFAVLMTEHVSASSDYFTGQLEKTGTYANAYSGLMKKFDEISAQTSVPADIYKSSVSEEWLAAAMNEKINGTFQQLDFECMIEEPDFSLLDEKLTGYFEEYALENHVIRDETYTARLDATIENAHSAVISAIDVFHISTIQKSGIWNKLVILRSRVPGVKPYVIAAAAVCIVLLIVLGNPVYWTGTALFASGLILTVPSALILASNVIMKFSVKEYTVFTLVTQMLRSLDKTVLITGVSMLSAGLIMTVTAIIFVKNKKETDSK